MRTAVLDLRVPNGDAAEACAFSTKQLQTSSNSLVSSGSLALPFSPARAASNRAPAA